MASLMFMLVIFSRGFERDVPRMSNQYIWMESSFTLPSDVLLDLIVWFVFWWEPLIVTHPMLFRMYKKIFQQKLFFCFHCSFGFLSFPSNVYVSLMHIDFSKMSFQTFLHISVPVPLLSVPGCTSPAGECMLFWEGKYKARLMFSGDIPTLYTSAHITATYSRKKKKSFTWFVPSAHAAPVFWVQYLSPCGAILSHLPPLTSTIFFIFFYSCSCIADTKK